MTIFGEMYEVYQALTPAAYFYVIPLEQLCDDSMRNNR